MTTILATYLDGVCAPFASALAFSWSDVLDFSKFSDITIYGIMAVFGTAIFVVKLLLTLFVGIDADADFDTDMDGGLEAHTGDFSMFSILSVISFLMGAGWMGLACRAEWGMSGVASFFAALGFGTFLMFISSFGLYQMRRMNVTGGYDPKNAIGKIARVYLRIPERGKGEGQIQVDIDGNQKVMPAVSASAAIDSFAAVKVIDVLDGDTLIVEPA